MSSAKFRRTAQPSSVHLLIHRIVGQVSGSFLSQKTSSGAGSLCWVPPEHDNTSPLSQEEGLETQPCLQHPAESEPLLPVASVLPAKPCLMFQGPYGLSLLDPTTRGTEESLISKPSDWAMCLVQSNGLCAQMRGYFQEEPLKGKGLSDRDDVAFLSS
ncbi:uncharacterized protein LOC144235954 isoform X2 [Crocuta crocuta]